MQYRFFIFFIWVNGFSIGSVFGSDDFQNRRNAGDQRQYFLDFLSLLMSFGGSGDLENKVKPIASINQ